MENRNEIRKAHEIVDKIYPIHEREALRKLLPPRPEFTFGDAIQALKGLASEDDVHLWSIIGHLERFEKSYSATPAGEDEGLPIEGAPEGSLAAIDGDGEVWRKEGSFWTLEGTDLFRESERMKELDFKILRWGWDGK